MSAATTNDRLRQVFVTVSEVVCVYGTLLGFGVIGTRVEKSASGAFAENSTLITPAGPAFSIWSFIYLGLLAYTIWQWFVPTNQVARSTGWFAGISMILNAVWIMAAQASWVWASVVVIVLMEAALTMLAFSLPQKLGSLAERIAVGAAFGLYLGWITVATCANFTAAFVYSGVRPSLAVAQLLAVLVLVVASGVGVGLMYKLRAQSLGMACALAMFWGLVWIGSNRLFGEPESPTVGLVALAAAVIVLGSHIYFAIKRNPPRAAGMSQPA